VTALGIAALSEGLFFGRGASLVGLGAAVIFLGVAILSPLVARPFARAAGSPLPAVAGVAGKLGPWRTRCGNPKRTASTAAALMIGLGLVSFVSIFAASIKTLHESGARADAEGRLHRDVVLSFTGFSQDIAARLEAIPPSVPFSQFRQGISRPERGSPAAAGRRPRHPGPRSRRTHAGRQRVRPR
jgi:putative ABC transport system permease protein